MRVKTAVALVSVAGGLGCIAGAGYEALHYSSWANPGALNYMVQFAGAALLLFAIPAAMAVIWLAGEIRRDTRRLGLTPGQAALIEFAVLEAAHHEWAKYNREWSEHLTDSVMGPERGGAWPGN